MTRRPPLPTALLFLLTACDAAVVAEAGSRAEAEAEAEVAVSAEAAVQGEIVAGADVNADAVAKVEIAPEAFKLVEVTALVQSGTIETAEELELAVNDPEAELNRLDIDADGQVDHVEVVEVRGEERVDFQFKVIPSSRATVVHAVDLATASVVANRASSEVSFSANFSAGVHFSAGASVQAEMLSFVAPAQFEASAVVVAQPLLAWALVLDRPVYHSVHIEHGTGKWIPPGHLKHGHWKATGGLPPGHAHGHGKLHGHGHGHGHGHVEVGGHGHGHGGGHGKAKIEVDAPGKGHGNSGKSGKHDPGPAPKKADPPSPPKQNSPKNGGDKGGSSGGGKSDNGKGGSSGKGGKGKK